MKERKYAFSWALLGDMEAGRPNLGPNMHLAVYRLMQFSFRDILEQNFGSDEADRLFREAGELAGREFFHNALGEIPADLAGLVRVLQVRLKELGIGVLRLEEQDPENLEFTLTVAEDLDCSGLPDLGFEVCIYDEGFLAGILGAFTGRPFEVREVECWCTGDRTCRFEARPVEG